MTNNILTIDGPSGVGKGTVARIVAVKKNWNLLDSGAIYRAFALSVKNKNIDIGDKEALSDAAVNLDLEFKSHPSKELLCVYLNQKEVSLMLRTEEVAELASKLAAFNFVRAALLSRQQNFAKEPGLVADGRDMGTIVFSSAPYKVFLTASIEQRAKRRLKQLQMNGVKGIISQILADVKKRDERDYQRKDSPLIAAKDALIVDTSDLSISEVVTRVMTLIKA